MMKSVLIVGAGPAGASAAQALRAGGFDGRVALLGDESHAPYDRPTLSKGLLTGEAETAPALFDDAAFQKLDVDWRPGEVVHELDLNARRARTDAGWLEADAIVLATGSAARRLPVLGAELAGVHHLRTLDDGRRLREALTSADRLAIVGGGLIGCEVATSARKLGLEVTLLEADDELLLRALGPELGRSCRAHLEALGVAVRLGAAVTRMYGAERVEGLELATSERIACDQVLVSIGAVPNAGLAQAAGLAVAGGVVVNAHGATAVPGVYAVGDVAAWPLRDGPPRSVETYFNAESQARSAVAAMLGQPRPALPIPLAWTSIAGSRIQTAGVLNGPGELVWRGAAADRFCGTVFRVDRGRVLACASVDAPREFAIARRLAEAAVATPSAVLLDPAADLREVLQRAA